MGQVIESTQSTKDCISRQVAIDKINERQRKLIYCFGFENDAVKIMDIAKSIIIAMPSAQSEGKTYEDGWREGREALRREIWEDERERLD